jgi:hypothetical protein
MKYNIDRIERRRDDPEFSFLDKILTDMTEV